MGRAPPATAAKSIQLYVSRLRKELGEGRLVTRPPGYVLRVERSELDVARFEQLVGEARVAEPERAARKLREALALWRGRPLADLAYEPFAQAEIARLEELRLDALELRVEADLAGGRHTQLVGELEALVAEHPLRERLWMQLMLALYRSARQAEALEAYRGARRVLDEQLGLEPERRAQAAPAVDPRARPGAGPRAGARKARCAAAGHARAVGARRAGGAGRPRPRCLRSRNRWRRRDRRASWSSPPWCRPPT